MDSEIRKGSQSALRPRFPTETLATGDKHDRCQPFYLIASRVTDASNGKDALRILGISSQA